LPQVKWIDECPYEEFGVVSGKNNIQTIMISYTYIEKG
jgi:hypothetical protein